MKPAPITPGEILLEEYLKPMGISQNAMARAIGVPQRAVNEIVLGRRSITPSMSIRFGVFFGQSENFWFGLQMTKWVKLMTGISIPAKPILALPGWWVATRALDSVSVQNAKSLPMNIRGRRARVLDDAQIFLIALQIDGHCWDVKD